MSVNPLLASIEDFIDHRLVQAEHIAPAIDELLNAARQTLEGIAHLKEQPTWENVIESLDSATERLWRAWTVIGHLNAVVHSADLREAYHLMLPKVSEFSTWLSANKDLYQQFQRLHQLPDFFKWPASHRRVVELALREFHLSGVQLEGQARLQYMALCEQQAQLSQKFSDNVLDATDSWSLLISDLNRLSGIPCDVQSAAHQAAQAQGLEGWQLTLKMPCYLPVMQYAEDRNLRETLYRAYSTLASEQDQSTVDNTSVIEALLKLRAQESALLGYQNYADLRLQTCMVQDVQQVQTFLRDLAARARPFAERDLNELKDFALTAFSQDNLQAWDIAFFSEKRREKRYAYSENEIKQYFPVDHVLAGLFEVINCLFKVRFKSASMSTWHPDVKTLQLENSQGDILGFLYLDLYARPGKQSGAWVDAQRHRRRTDHSFHTPIIYLTCNFSPPSIEKPSLLTHDDVITLFHEMGHALHSLLSEVDTLGLAPFTNMEWDAIELPSQFMENFCWQWSVIQKISAHVQTGEALPRQLYDRLCAARHFQSGLQTLRQVEYSLFDILLHHQNTGLDIQTVLTVLNQVRDEVAVLFPPEWHRFPHSFSHLFAGGYSAGYYSYKWAEVLSADAFEAFEEKVGQASNELDILNADCGQRFRQEILAIGATRPAAASFEAFRGRPPRMDAFLRHQGMSAAVSSIGAAP